MDKQTYNTLKKEVDKLRKFPGKQRGEHIKFMVNYVEDKEGKEGLNELLDTLKDMDFDLGGCGITGKHRRDTGEDPSYLPGGRLKW